MSTSTFHLSNFQEEDVHPSLHEEKCCCCICKHVFTPSGHRTRYLYDTHAMRKMERQERLQKKLRQRREEKVGPLVY